MNWLKIPGIFFLCWSVHRAVFAQVDAVAWQMQDSHSTASFRGICAVSEKVAWLGGSQGNIRRTINGGKTWEVISAPAGTETLDFRDVEAWDKDTALLMSAGEGESSAVFKTTDGGHTWKKVYANPFEKGFFNGMAFWNEKDGILTGDPVGGALFIAKTQDGGHTWQRIEPSRIPASKEGEYEFSASGSHITVQGKTNAWIGTGGKTARVFYSKDQGNTWKVAHTPMIQGKNSTGIFSADFQDAEYGLAAGGDYTKEKEGQDNLIYTKNGGKTWKLLPGQSVNFVSAVRFAREFVILAGPANTYISFDKGKTRKELSDFGFHTLSVSRDGKGIWAAGRGGKVGKLVWGKK